LLSVVVVSTLHAYAVLGSPWPLQSAIVLVGLKGLAEPHEAIRYYCVNKAEFFVWLTTYALCITTGPVYGIGVGVILALLLVLLRYTVARTVILGR
jgi:MFS superfamily sulfate permease-like transporter